MSRLTLLCALLLAGCASSESIPAGKTPPDFATSCERLSNRKNIPPGLLWFRTAAEQRAAFQQAFRLAAANLESFAQGRRPGTWAVVADADETLIDNGFYECELELRGLKKSDAALFTQWVDARLATATAGAAAFSTRVHELGGRLIVVSNRDEVPHQQATVDTLSAAGIRADAVLLSKGEDDRRKDLRFDRIRKYGVPDLDIPPQDILMWLGDNLRDFPLLTQEQPGDLAEFGHRYIVLPNPLYGSFLANRLH